MKTQNAQYGLFYKSQGRWVGPYGNTVGSKRQISEVNNLVKPSLKARTELRKLKFV